MPVKKIEGEFVSKRQQNCNYVMLPFCVFKKERRNDVMDEIKNRVHEELRRARGTWCDLPEYVYTDEYEMALLNWVKKHVAAGRTDIDTLVVYALHHETDNNRPYFPFNRRECKK